MVKNIGEMKKKRHFTKDLFRRHEQILVVSFFLAANSFQSVFSCRVTSFSVEMSSGSPSGSEGADPVLATDNEVSIGASDIGTPSSVSRKSACRSFSRSRSVSLVCLQKQGLPVGQILLPSRVYRNVPIRSGVEQTDLWISLF